MAAAPTHDEVRAELRAWLDSNWDPDLELGEWWDRLAEARWSVPAWPEEWYGRGWGRDLAGLVEREIKAYGAVGAPGGLGLLLAGPTILTHGSQEQKQRYIPPIVKGTEGWCQLFSEPGAGSDLASLQTKAERDGDEWIINGQKVWTSGGAFADLGMLMARTNVDVPKHAGISYFALPMQQDGIDVRALREMTGYALFSEVFIDDARVHNDALIGGEGNGWKVGMTTLMFERAGLGSGGSGHSSQAPAGTKAGALPKRVGDFIKRGQGGGGGIVGVVNRSASFVIDTYRDRGQTADPIMRQHLAELYTLNEIGRFNLLRMKVGTKPGGLDPSKGANIAKLMQSNTLRLARDVGLQLLDAEAMLSGGDAYKDGIMQEVALFSPGPSIYGGTDQIQRNIIGERHLGLPAEPRTDKDVPFKDLKVGTQKG